MDTQDFKSEAGETLTWKTIRGLDLEGMTSLSYICTSQEVSVNTTKTGPCLYWSPRIPAWRTGPVHKWNPGFSGWMTTYIRKAIESLRSSHALPPELFHHPPQQSLGLWPCLRSNLQPCWPSGTSSGPVVFIQVKFKFFQRLADLENELMVARERAGGGDS